MRIDETRTYWVLLLPVKFSGVPWFVQDTGIPTSARKTHSIRDAKKFSNQEAAVEWGKHLDVPVVVKKIIESRTYVTVEET